MMKAVMVTDFGGPDVLQYTDVHRPAVRSNEVLIKVAAASINFADIKARYGKYHGAGKPPFVPGLDVAGTIEEVGAEVKNLQAGQRVIAFPNHGSYAEYTTADEILTFPIPDHIDLETAAASPIVSFTSYNLLMKCARLQKGETVLIHSASGGIGTTAIQLAKLLGAGMVIATVGNDLKKEIAYQMGADHVFNYNTESFVDHVLNLTHNHGADVILDSLAGHIFEQSLDCLAHFGRIVNFGNGSGKPGSFQTNGLHASCRSVLGYSFGTTRKLRPQTLADTAETVLAYLAKGELQMLISKKFSLKEAAQAHAWIENRHSTGKVLLLP